MIKRFKFLVIILVASIYSVINCSGFEKNLQFAIHFTDNRGDFSKLTPEQEVCYLPQIHEKHLWLPIDYACWHGNVSAFRWLLSNGAVPTQECFESAILSKTPKSEIVSGLLSCGLYTKYIGEKKTLKRVQDKRAFFSRLATERPDLFAIYFAEAQKICLMISRYEDRVNLRTEWIKAVGKAQAVNSGFGYGAGSGVVVSGDCVKIEE